jgi:hypothetical protein
VQEQLAAAIKATSFFQAVVTREADIPAQDSLEAMGQDDVEAVLSLRISARERVWGILDGPALQVLWWDPEHQVYPVERRNR